MGASGAHGATIVPECVCGYGTKRLISGSFAIDSFFAGRVSKRGIIVHLSWNEILETTYLYLIQIFNYGSAAYSECLPGRATCIIVHLRDMGRLSQLVRPLPPTGPVGVLHDAEFLLFVGNKVREARSRRGMTRKMLAHEADVSERHLAQLELGEGNVSIVLLRRITTALNIPIAEVFTADKPNAAQSSTIFI